jgi:hypothetical protein
VFTGQRLAARRTQTVANACASRPVIALASPTRPGPLGSDMPNRYPRGQVPVPARVVRRTVTDSQNLRPRPSARRDRPGPNDNARERRFAPLPISGLARNRPTEGRGPI